MIFKKKAVLIVFIFVSSVIIPAGAAMEFAGQAEEKILAPRYRAFLAETQMFMNEEEKDLFLRLESDGERNNFIESFWQQRGGRQQALRANIGLLMLMRMVQALDLTENQVAKFMPVLNQSEREKQQLQNRIMKELRELRLLIRDEAIDEKSLSGKVGAIRELEKRLREKEREWNAFIEQNLSLVQQAKYILFAQDFYRELRDKLNDARRIQQSLRELNKKR